MEKPQVKASPSMQIRSNGYKGFRAAPSNPLCFPYCPSAMCPSGDTKEQVLTQESCQDPLEDPTQPHNQHRGNPITGDPRRPVKEHHDNKAEAPSHNTGPARGQAPCAHLRSIFFPPASSNALESQQLTTSPALAKHQGFTRAQVAKRIRPQGI